MANDETWLSICEAAEQLQVHPRTLRRYIRSGKLQVLRLSPQVVRIDRAQIDDFLSDHVRVTTGTGTCYVPRPQVEGEHDFSRPIRTPEPVVKEVVEEAVEPVVEEAVEPVVELLPEPDPPFTGSHFPLPAHNVAVQHPITPALPARPRVGYFG